MFKNTFKAILAVVLLLGLNTLAFAAVDVITGNNTWYTAVLGGRFGISLSDNLEVAHSWSFKYNNVKAKSASSMKKG